MEAADPTRTWFWCLVTAQLVLWTAICLITQPNMPLDMVEMLYWGQQWQWGYHKHPPLPAWTAATMWNLGGQHPWLIYVTSQLTITVTMWAVWQLAREILSPKLAFCSVVALLGCYYCTYLVNDINNTIMTRPFWALSILFLYRANRHSDNRQRTIYWCLAGVAIGLGMLCKYYIAVLVICMMAVPLFIPDTRKSLRTVGPWLMAGIAGLIFLPHFLWMIDNDFITIRYVFDRSSDAAAGEAVAGWTRHVLSPVQFVLSQVGAFLPVVILLLPLLRPKNGSIDSSDEVTRRRDATQHAFDLQYLLVVVAGPVVFYLLLSALTGASIRSMWGGPLFSFLALLLLVAFNVQQNQPAIRRVIITSLMVGVTMAVALFIRNGVGPSVRQRLSKVHFPGQEVSQRIRDAWEQSHDHPLPIVGGDMFIAGCVGVYAPAKVDVYSGLQPSSSPWTSDDDLKRRGGVIVWNADDSEQPPLNWQHRFPEMKYLPPVVCKSKALTGDLSATVGVALISPNSHLRLAQRPR